MATGRLSVEISSSAVRMAEVVVGRGQPELVRIGQVALPPRAVLDGVILDVAAVRVALERCIKEEASGRGRALGRRRTSRSHTRARACHSCLTRKVTPQCGCRRSTSSRSRSTGRSSPPSPGGDRRREQVPKRRVLVAAAHRDLVDPLVQIVTAAGLTPVSVEPTSLR